MKKTVYILMFAAMLATGLVSCSKFDDMSKNPYALYQKDAPAEGYIHPIMFKTQYNLLGMFRNNTIMLMQYGVSVTSENASIVIDNYEVPEGVVDDMWTTFYPQLGNAIAMYDKAVKENNAPMQAVAMILQIFYNSACWKRPTRSWTPGRKTRMRRSPLFPRYATLPTRATSASGAASAILSMRGC